MKLLDRHRRSDRTTASPLLDSARWRHALLAQPCPVEAPIEALEHALLRAPLSRDPAVREAELRAQGEVLLQRVEGIYDGLDPVSPEWDQLRPVVSFLYQMAGLEVPTRLQV